MEQLTTHFKSLTLKNFRLFEEKTFAFNEQFNVLIGQNGTGKSSVLDALKLPIMPYFSGLINTNSGGVYEIQDTDIRGQIIHHDGAPSTLERQYPCEVTATMSILGKPCHEYLTRPQQFPSKELYFLGKEFSKKLQGDKHFTLPAFAYYGVTRAIRPEMPQSMFTTLEIASRKRGYDDALFQSLNPLKFAEWLKILTYISLQENVESDLMKATLEVVYTCLPEVKRIEFRIKENSVMVTFENDDVQRFNNLSDGYRAVMALAADIAYRMATLNPHLGKDVAQKTPGIVLIDELDLHLHPKWQRRIVGDLKRAFPLIQFITTTHSPFIIQSLKLGEVLNLGAEKPMEENFNALSIEDIAEEVMDIPLPQRSKRYQDMYDAAAEYFNLIEQAANAGEAEKAELECRLNTLSEPFSDDVAYHAFLNSKRIAANARASRKGNT